MSKFDYKGFLKNNPLLNEVYDKESLLHKLGDWDDALIRTHDGRELIIINPDNGNLDNEELYNDNTFFALTQDGEEVELSYSDVASLETGKSYTASFEDEVETDYSEKRKKESDYVSEDEDRSAILNRLRQSVKDDRDDEDEDEDGIEVGTEPEEAPKPKRLSAADRKAKHRAKYQDRAKANKEKAAQRERDRIEDTKNNVLLSNRHSINVYTGKIHALDGSGNIYDSIDDAPTYFLNTLKDRDKHIIWQVTNKRLEEELQGKDVNALALVTLDSVGHYLDIDTAEVYPINADNTPDFKNAFSLHDEIDEEFINALSERDRLVVAKYTDQVM